MSEPEFTVSGFKPRQHKRKRENVMDKTIFLNDMNDSKRVMDKQFKNPPIIREYWKLRKREERARKKANQK